MEICGFINTGNNNGEVGVRKKKKERKKEAY